MTFKESDKTAVDNLIKILKFKAKFNDLSGMELLAASQAMVWLGNMSEKIKQDLENVVVSTPRTSKKRVKKKEK